MYPMGPWSLTSYWSLAIIHVYSWTHTNTGMSSTVFRVFRVSRMSSFSTTLPYRPVWRHAHTANPAINQWVPFFPSLIRLPSLLLTTQSKNRKSPQSPSLTTTGTLVQNCKLTCIPHHLLFLFGCLRVVKSGTVYKTISSCFHLFPLSVTEESSGGVLPCTRLVPYLVWQKNTRTWL